MLISELFDGASYSNGELIIPRTSLEAVGLHTSNTNLASIACAVFLLSRQYFIGNLVINSDGNYLDIGDGNILSYDQNTLESELNIKDHRKFIDSEDNLHYQYEVIKYE
jgi:hypothetical protein